MGGAVTGFSGAFLNLVLQMGLAEGATLSIVRPPASRHLDSPPLNNAKNGTPFNGGSSNTDSDTGTGEGGGQDHPRIGNGRGNGIGNGRGNGIGNGLGNGIGIGIGIGNGYGYGNGLGIGIGIGIGNESRSRLYSLGRSADIWIMLAPAARAASRTFTTIP